MAAVTQNRHLETKICGITFSCVDRQRAARWLFEAAKDRRGGYVCVTGAHGIVTAQDDPGFRDILNSASMNTLDGQPAVWLTRWRGLAVERVTGRELLLDLVATDKLSEIQHVLFGSTLPVTDKMICRLRELCPQIKIQASNPPFTSMSEDELCDVCKQFDFTKPTIVWVGLSTPKQERVAAQLSQLLPNATIVAIGAGFDFVAGLVPAAPPLFKLLCLEWLFRTAMDPRRLFKRYAKIVPRYTVLLWRELMADKKPQQPLR